MTWELSISRARKYVLGGGDTGSYIGTGDDPDRDGYPLLPGERDVKPRPVSSYTLALCGGCRAIRDDFLSLVAKQVSPGDDLDTCQAAAHEAVTWLAANDRPGELYPWAGSPNGIGKRGSIADGEFNVRLAGFRRDGTTAAYQWDPMLPSGVNEWEEFDDADQGEYICGVPYGVPVESLVSFFALLEAPLGVADAFAHGRTSTRAIYELHPDRITSEYCGFALLWRDEGPLTTRFACDATDDAWADSIYSELRGLELAIERAKEPA